MATAYIEFIYETHGDIVILDDTSYPLDEGIEHGNLEETEGTP